MGVPKQAKERTVGRGIPGAAMARSLGFAQRIPQLGAIRLREKVEPEGEGVSVFQQRLAPGFQSVVRPGGLGRALRMQGEGRFDSVAVLFPHELAQKGKVAALRFPGLQAVEFREPAVKGVAQGQGGTLIFAQPRDALRQVAERVHFPFTLAFRRRCVVEGRIVKGVRVVEVVHSKGSRPAKEGRSLPNCGTRRGHG